MGSCGNRAAHGVSGGEAKITVYFMGDHAYFVRGSLASAEHDAHPGHCHRDNPYDPRVLS